MMLFCPLILQVRTLGCFQIVNGELMRLALQQVVLHNTFRPAGSYRHLLKQE